MFLAEAAHVAGLRFPLIGYFVPRLPFDPVELVEELERLCGRPALFLPRLEGVGKAPSGVGHAAQMRGAFQCAPGRIAVTHQDAAIVAEEGLRMFLPATGLIVEQHDRLFAVLAAAVGPHIRSAGRGLALLLEHLNRSFVAMNDVLGPKPQLQGVKDAMQVPLARSNHPTAQCTAADRYPCALEGLRQTIQRCAIDVFMNKGKGQRRGRGNAARQGLCGHRRNDDRRGDPGAVAIAACIFGAGILKGRGLHLDVKLLGYHFPHAMHPFAAARADLLVVGEVILDALARQVGRKCLAPALLPFWLSRLRQSRVGKIGGDRLIDVVVSIVGIVLQEGLLGFIEDTIQVLFAARRKAVQPRQRQFLLKLQDAPGKRVSLGRQCLDFSGFRRQKRHQFRNSGDAASIHRSLESKARSRVNGLQPTN